MIVLGLMGSIGSGKSLVAKYLKMNFKAAVFDADKLVYELYKNDKNIINKAQHLFPESVINGVIDRSSLVKRFIQDGKQWDEFENLVHSIIRKKHKNFLMQSRRNMRKYVVLDIPLLVEGNYHKSCDAILWISLKNFLRGYRLFTRKLSPGQLQATTNKQLSHQQRKKIADFEIKNSLSRAHTCTQLNTVMARLGRPTPCC